MEFRIKTAKDGQIINCELSGKEESALVKLYTSDDKGETPWMGASALIDAFKLLQPLLKPSQAVVVPAAPQQTMQYAAPMTVQTEIPDLSAYGVPPELSGQPAAPAPQAAPAVYVANPEDLKDLDRQLTQLSKNPPPDKNGNAQTVLPEASLRELVGGFVNRFRDPMAMFPVVVRHVPQMTRDRFQLQLNAIKKEARVMNRMQMEEEG